MLEQSISPLATRAAAALKLAALSAFGLYAATVALGAGEGRTADLLFHAVLGCTVLLAVARSVLVRVERPAWSFLAFGLAAWWAGELHFTLFLADIYPTPFPSLGDAGFAAFYAATYIALGLLIRARIADVRLSLWLDGMIVALAASAATAAFLFAPVLASADGYADAWAVVTNLAYPIADLVLVSLAVGVCALTGWRPPREWVLLIAGLVTAAVADLAYIQLAASGTYALGSALDVLWPAALLMTAWSAWQPSRSLPRIRLEGWRVLVVPGLSAFVALSTLVACVLGTRPAAALWLATAALAVVVVRMAMTYGENMRMLEQVRVEALTDALTRLRNRRRFMLDLDDELRCATTDDPSVLVLYDLDGFKAYNDSFGHPAGDALLTRLGAKLTTAVRGIGHSYRLGGDEFCVLLRGEQLQEGVAAASAALTEHGEGFRITASGGIVSLPAEASEATGALQLADARLYAHKRARASATLAGEQTRDVLLRALQEREPALGDHVLEVAELAESIARRLGLGPDEVRETARAAELHDIGKIAIPDAILNKPGPLDSEEWRFMRQHTVLGERILSAAPALVSVARLVRSSHERYDGAGYPDGLVGEDIPLGARIVAACDSFDAMVTDRPYRAGIGSAAAVDELLREAGAQFDPRVVEALCEELAQRQVASREQFAA